MQFAQAHDVRAVSAGVEAVVGLGQSLVAGDHQFGAVVVVGFAGRFERGVGLKAGGKGKVAKQSDGV